VDFILQGFINALELLKGGDSSVWSAIFATIKVSTGSMLLSISAGVPCGFCLGYFNFRGKRAVRTVVDTLLSLPTVFVGLMVYAFISRQGPLGEFGLLFTLTGIAIGQSILAFPVVTALTAAAVEGIDSDLHLTLISLGAGKKEIFLTSLWEVRFGIVAAVVTAYGRVMTEVGISMMVGGNIKWHTRTIATAIALETGKGMFANGIALGLVLLAIAFGVNLSLVLLRKKYKTYRSYGVVPAAMKLSFCGIDGIKYMNLPEPSLNTPDIFELNSVQHIYNGRIALDINRLVIGRATITGVVGPNGSGKSTLLKLLAFTMRPTRGAICFNGKSELPFSKSVRFNITLLTQEPYLLKRTVYENIRYGLKIRNRHGIAGNSDKQIIMKIRIAMSHVGLDFKTFAQRRWSELSGGEAQRVAMAARLALKPEVLLLDDPTSSVDRESAEKIRDAAKTARERWGTTIVVASHDRNWLDGLCDTHINLINSTIIT